MSVLVLMSTYNGERYIKTQMDSILKQDYADIEILVRDDGSTDSTCSILAAYAKEYPEISWYSGNNLGVQNSFFDLIYRADLKYDYYAFADQDDFWLPGKISRAVHKLEAYPKDMPTLYCSDKIIVDKDLNPIKVTVSRVMKKATFGNALVQDMCTGCTAVMNMELLKIIQGHIPDYTIMHDWWFYLVATCFGEVFYDKESYILYRQHGNNASGAMLSKRKLLCYRLEQLNRPRGQIYRQAEAFLESFKDFKINNLQVEIKNKNIVLEEKYQLLEIFLKSKVLIGYRIRVIFNRRFFRQKPIDDLVFRLIIILGKL